MGYIIEKKLTQHACQPGKSSLQAAEILVLALCGLLNFSTYIEPGYNVQPVTY